MKYEENNAQAQKDEITRGAIREMISKEKNAQTTREEHPIFTSPEKGKWAFTSGNDGTLKRVFIPNNEREEPTPEQQYEKVPMSKTDLIIHLARNRGKYHGVVFGAQDDVTPDQAILLLAEWIDANGNNPHEWRINTTECPGTLLVFKNR